jgi:hypothetical protein
LPFQEAITLFAEDDMESGYQDRKKLTREEKEGDKPKRT